MNKTEKIICLLLGGVLAWYLFFGGGNKKSENAVEAVRAAAAATNAVPASAAVMAADAAPAPAPEAPKAASPAVPEKKVTLENDELKLELSSWGAVVKKAVLKKYAAERGEISQSNPALEFDFSSSPLGELGGMRNLAPNAPYEIRDISSNSVVFVNAVATRKISLGSGYLVTYEETFHKDVGALPETAAPVTLSLGVMGIGASKNGMLSVDSWAKDAGKGKEGVVHHCETGPLEGWLVGGAAGGCGGSKSAQNIPLRQNVDYPGSQKWVALKNRFFVTALCSSTEENAGFSATIARDPGSAEYRPQSISSRAIFRNVGEKRTSVFFIGPKKQSLLWDLGMRDVMEFGMWRWLCYPIVWSLNFFNSYIPGFGIAIILLTILVRIIFWPLTHKSTVGMKKMQEIQPLMKEIHAKYKDNPQRMQQETFALYREHKVNPMSSCLPMLIQIPVFIALFNVLRSAVELRYAPFLWIGDLSEPEGLFASWFPFGGLNILPILMAATMALQSALTPSTGDKNQQRMMMVMMPVMMLFMFYSFPSALSLYWTLSQVLSIVQMWMIRRKIAAEKKLPARA